MAKSACLWIESDRLSHELVFGRGDHCLDTATGDVVPAEKCPADSTGEGRPALRQGKRLIRLPILDEIWQEWREQESLKPTCVEFGDPELDKLNFRIVAADAIARNWIASLRPSFVVVWHDGRTYDPVTATWRKWAGRQSQP